MGLAATVNWPRCQKIASRLKNNMLRNLDTDLLRAFVTVSETNSFTKASKLLFRTQAAVSMQVKRLEELIGKPIFLRGARGLTLTGEGEFLMGYARRILTLNDEIFANLTSSHVSGVVRVGAPDDYAMAFLPAILLLFGRRFPNVRVEIVCGNSVDLVRDVEAEQLDLALVTRDPDRADGEVLRRERLYWVTANQNSPHAEAVLPLALFPSGCVCRSVVLRALRESGRDWRVVLSSRTISAILAAVNAGVAVTAMEECTIPPTLRRLGEADGFPVLGSVDVALYTAPGSLKKTAEILAEFMRVDLRAVPPTGIHAGPWDGSAAQTLEPVKFAAELSLEPQSIVWRGGASTETPSET
jgi:DNA-binding transcriptional LysR family regulator